MNDRDLVFAAMRAAKPTLVEAEPAAELATVVDLHPLQDGLAPVRPSPSRWRTAVALTITAAAVVAIVVVAVEWLQTEPALSPAAQVVVDGWCAQDSYVDELSSNDPPTVRAYYTDRFGYALTSAQIAPNAIEADAALVAEEYRRIHDALEAVNWDRDTVDTTLSPTAEQAETRIDAYRIAMCNG